MDLTAIIASGASVILGITVVALFVKKYIGKGEKAVAIATEALNIINDSIIAVKPDADGTIRITTEEAAEISRHVGLLKAALKS
jgi:hypothetical protein